MKRSIFLSIFISFFVLLGLEYGLFERIELILFDARVRLVRAKVEAPKDVLVILIDEESLKMMNRVVGRWPWPRDVHGEVINFLRLGGAKAMLFDILFTEHEKNCRTLTNGFCFGDLRLVEETAYAGNVFHAMQIFRDIPDEWNKDLLNKPLPKEFVEKHSIRVQTLRWGENNNYALPFGELYMSSFGVGVVEFSPDMDGVYRRTELIRCYQDNCFPLLGLAPFLAEHKPKAIKERDGHLELFLSDGQLIKVPYVGGKYVVSHYGRFETYSMSGVLASVQRIRMGSLEDLPVDPEEFKDKVVFIGASAVGLEDLKPTPMGPKTPGVLLHASIYGNLKTGDFIKFPPKFVALLSVFLLSYSTALVIFSVKSFYKKIILSILPTLGFALFCFVAFYYNVLFQLSAPIASGALTYLTGFAYLSLTEEREKRRIRSMFSRYVSTAVLSEIERNRESVLLSEGGRRVELSVMFSDIAGFTQMSEVLPAEKVVEVINSYFSKTVEILFKHNATLDKFIGDAFMAFWGAPIPIKDHAYEAVITAIEIQKSMPEVNAKLKTKGLPPIKVGIGINTGEVVLGNIGAHKRFDYTVIGDNVNLASRLEGLTRFYDVPILISEKTFQLVEGRIPSRVVDMVRVKGKKEPVRIYQPFEDQRTCSLFEEGFNHYLMGRWEEALRIYEEVLKTYPEDKVASIFVNRCAYLLKNPPTDWTGIWEFKEK